MSMKVKKKKVIIDKDLLKKRMNNVIISDFDLECAICLQPCVHPAELPCGHIFCFLCVKGIVFQNKRCALCRQVIPREYINNPTLVKWSAVLEKQKSVDDQYQWFYEGHNGE